MREILGVDPALLARWSQRDKTINRAQGDLVADFQQRHGRTPTPTELHDLAQRATLETREAKHEPRSLAEQRQLWAAQADETLGRYGTAHILARALHRSPLPPGTIDEARLQRLAANVASVVQRHRSWWQPWQIRAEALRQVRRFELPELASILDRVVGLALERPSVRVTPDGAGISEPAELRRPDGSSVYTRPAPTRRSSCGKPFWRAAWTMPATRRPCCRGGSTRWIVTVRSPGSAESRSGWPRTRSGGPYLTPRSEVVHDLASQVSEASGDAEPRWQEVLSADLSPELVAHVSVWRAAMGVPADDQSPTGSTQAPGAAARWQHVLDHHLLLSSPALRHWTTVARQLAPQLRDDPQTPLLAAKLASLVNEGENVSGLLERALRRTPLPDDQAAAALLYRLKRRPQHKPIDDVWETIEPTESMGQRDERTHPPGTHPSHDRGIGI